MSDFTAEIRISEKAPLTFSDPRALQSWLQVYVDALSTEATGDRLAQWKAARTALGVSQSKVGGLLGISQTEVSRIETAKTPVPGDLLARLLKLQPVINARAPITLVKPRCSSTPAPAAPLPPLVPLRQPDPPPPARRAPAPTAVPSIRPDGASRPELPAKGGEQVAGFAVEVSRVANPQAGDFQRAREDLGISSVEAARRLGTNPDMIWRIEGCRAQPINPAAWASWKDRLAQKIAPLETSPTKPPDPRPAGSTRFF